jgi:hypothetical protein
LVSIRVPVPPEGIVVTGGPPVVEVLVVGPGVRVLVGEAVVHAAALRPARRTPMISIIQGLGERWTTGTLIEATFGCALCVSLPGRIGPSVEPAGESADPPAGRCVTDQLPVAM